MKTVLFLIPSIIVLLFSERIVAQENYNRCSDALLLCPNEVVGVNNIDANSTLCPNCEDDFNYCFSGENTVWFTFITNEDGGDAELQITNLDFQTGTNLEAIIVEATVPCVPSSYTPVSPCEQGINNNFSLIATDLDPETEYYVIINGEEDAGVNAEANFNLMITGPAVDRDAFIFISVPDTICDGEPAQLIATIEGCDAQQPVRWFQDDVEIGVTSGNQLVTSELIDGGVIRAEVGCFEDCPLTLNSNEVTIEVISFPVDAGPDFEIFAGEEVQLEGFTDQTDFQWTPNIAISNPNSLTPIVSPTVTIQYYLTASNGECTLTDFCEVVVISALEIPNTFSPNGDGINDTWEILGIEKYPDVFIQIYDRWGQLVFQTNGYPPSKRWNGTSMNDRELAPSAYYYVINLRSDEFPEPIKGHVSIVR